VVCAPVEGKKEPTMLASTDENQDDLQHPNHDLSLNVMFYVIWMTALTHHGSMSTIDDAHDVSLV